MRISVVTPTYNRASFLPETIESVALQQYDDFEHIVVDDGSTDQTAEILARYPHLMVIRQKNSGEPAAVNAGITRVTGDIIVIVNSDDPLRSDAFSEAAKAFNENPQALLAYPDWEETDHNGHVVRVIQQRSNLTFETLLRSFNISIGPATFFRRSAIEQVGMRRLDRKYTGDLNLWMRIAAAGPLVHIPKVLGTHRVHDGAAMTTSRGWRMSWELAQLAKDCLVMPHGLPDLHRASGEIRSHAHSVAMKYCGRNIAARLFHFINSVTNNPTGFLRTRLERHWQLLTAALRRTIICIFRYLYNDPNLSVKRVIRSWLSR